MGFIPALNVIGASPFLTEMDAQTFACAYLFGYLAIVTVFCLVVVPMKIMKAAGCSNGDLQVREALKVTWSVLNNYSYWLVAVIYGKMNKDWGIIACAVLSLNFIGNIAWPVVLLSREGRKDYLKHFWSEWSAGSIRLALLFAVILFCGHPTPALHLFSSAKTTTLRITQCGIPHRLVNKWSRNVFELWAILSRDCPFLIAAVLLFHVGGFAYGLVVPLILSVHPILFAIVTRLSFGCNGCCRQFGVFLRVSVVNDDFQDIDILHEFCKKRRCIAERLSGAATTSHPNELDEVYYMDTSDAHMGLVRILVYLPFVSPDLEALKFEISGDKLAQALSVNFCPGAQIRSVSCEYYSEDEQAWVPAN